MAGRLGRFAATVVYSNYNTVSSRGFKRWLAPTLKLMKRRKAEMGPQPPMHRAAMVEWNYNAELFAFSKRLGEDFDSNLLQQALTTREYVIGEEEHQKAVGIEQPDIILKDNKQMVEAGDKIINSYVLRYIRTVIPRLPEEGVFALQQYLTSVDLLAMVGSNIGMSELILTNEVPPAQLVIADAFKALVACLAECSGRDRANLFVRDFIITQLIGKHIFDIWNIQNPVQQALNILSRDGKPPFEPRLVGDAGKNTILAAYQVGLYVNKEFVSVGFGETVPVATEMAALNLLAEFFNINETMKPIRFDVELKSDSSEPFANLSIQDWCEKNIEKLQLKNI